ncbi:MAG: polyphosphate kinase 1 [Myxococcales bacterium]|nr:MAG: polyphosphate kinase 1 [Myxococcales bacterium]
MTAKKNSQKRKHNKNIRRDRTDAEKTVDSGSEINIHGLRLDQPFGDANLYLNYEKSWLDFNWRVLREAKDPDRNPLLDRVRFLSIASSNLDEFYQKRVGALKKQVFAQVSKLTVDGMTPQQQIAMIRAEAIRMRETMAAALHQDIVPRLRGIGIYFKDYAELSDAERADADAYYAAQIFPLLTPLAVDPGHPFPFISNLCISLGVELKDKQKRWHFARVKVPPVRPRFVELLKGAQSGQRVFVPIEQIISANIQTLFTGVKIASVAAFRVTRSAEINDNLTEAEDLMDLISEELRSRKYAPVVRLQVDKDLSDRLRDLLSEELELEPEDVYVSEGFMELSSLAQIANLDGLDEHRAPRWKPRTHPIVAKRGKGDDASDLFALMRKGDLLVHFPYHAFNTSIEAFIRQAADDPRVLAIKQTFYRTTEDSDILLALVEAAEQGKQVAALVELKARFDEQRNIELARRLEESGVHVTYGLLGLKTHCKITLVVREDPDGIRRYFFIGTGNYNSVTARLYEDVGLFSCDPAIGEDLSLLFNGLTGYAPEQTYRKILVAPNSFRQRIEDLIAFEMNEARAGRPARIVMKMNSMEDPRIIQLFYQASGVGVSIDLIVRGVCRLIAGKPGVSDNIRVRSIIGHFLEHSRIYYFHHGGENLYFIGSGDLMRRNLDWRVEAIAPVEAEPLKNYLKFYLDAQLAETRLAWVMNERGEYRPLSQGKDDAATCHQIMMDHASKHAKPLPWARLTRSGERAGDAPEPSSDTGE